MSGGVVRLEINGVSSGVASTLTMVPATSCSSFTADLPFSQFYGLNAGPEVSPRL